MANPILNVTRTPAGVLRPGTQVTFTVDATDSDARSVVYSFTGSDLAGNTQTVTKTVVVSDPVAVSGSAADPAGTATVTQDPIDPRVWRSTV